MQSLEGGRGSADIDPKPPVLCVITSPTRGRPGGRDGTTEAGVEAEAMAVPPRRGMKGEERSLGIDLGDD